MSYRKVDGIFWTDPKVRNLTEQERYLFLYCLTCPSSHSSGIYYNPLPLISYETGINEKALIKAFGSLQEALMVYCGTLSGVVFVKNMLKFQAPNKNEKESISKHLKTIQDKKLLSMFLDTYTEYKQGFDKASLTLLEGFGKDTDTETETNTETETEKEYKESQPTLFPDKFDFDNVFKLYEEKGNREASKRYWDKLSKSDKAAALEKIPEYVRSSTIEFRKDFEKWIKYRCWNDKIISRKAVGVNGCEADKTYKLPEGVK